MNSIEKFDQKGQTISPANKIAAQQQVSAQNSKQFFSQRAASQNRVSLALRPSSTLQAGASGASEKRNNTESMQRDQTNKTLNVRKNSHAAKASNYFNARIDTSPQPIEAFERDYDQGNFRQQMNAPRYRAHSVLNAHAPVKLQPAEPARTTSNAHHKKASALIGQSGKGGATKATHGNLFLKNMFQSKPGVTAAQVKLARESPDLTALTRNNVNLRDKAGFSALTVKKP